MAPAKRRPFYLVAALVVSFLMGSAGCMEGYGALNAYRTEMALAPGTLDGVSEVRKAGIEQALGALTEVIDAHKRTGLPLTAAAFLLALAMTVLTVGAFVQRNRSPRMLAQVIGAHAVVVVLMYFALPQQRWAERDFIRAVMLGKNEAKAKNDEERLQVAEADKMFVRGAPAVQAGFLAVRTLVAGLVLLALLRRRTREYYDESRAPISER